MLDKKLQPTVPCPLLHPDSPVISSTSAALYTQKLQKPRMSLVYRPYLGQGVPRLFCCRETSKKEQAAYFLFPSASILNHIYFHFLLTIPIFMLFFSIGRTTLTFYSV
jgi:hypothetical protein